MQTRHDTLDRMLVAERPELALEIARRIRQTEARREAAYWEAMTRYSRERAARTPELREQYRHVD